MKGNFFLTDFNQRPTVGSELGQKPYAFEIKV